MDKTIMNHLCLLGQRKYNEAQLSWHYHYYYLAIAIIIVSLFSINHSHLGNSRFPRLDFDSTVRSYAIR
jgi:hypothetical protein